MPPPRKTRPIFRQSSNLALDGCLCRTISNWPRDDNWTLIQIRKIKLWPSTFEMAFKSANNFSQNLMACLTSKTAISYTYDWILHKKASNILLHICEQSDLKRGILPKCLFEGAFFEVTKINLNESLRQSLGPKIDFFFSIWLRLAFFAFSANILRRMHTNKTSSMKPWLT